MDKKLYSFVALLGLLVASSTLYLYSVVAGPSFQTPAASVSNLSADRYLKNVAYLASDAMKGRGAGSPELDQAAEYIASQFRLWGLKPAGDDHTYFQTFEVTTGIRIGAENELQISGTNLKINEDFVPIAFSNTAEAEGPVVFAGYGITAPELHYDDYRGVDVNGKIVVVLRHEPQELDPKSPFDGTNLTGHATFISKAINAKQHGAHGIVFITDPNNHSAEPDKIGAATQGTDSEEAGIPAVHAKRDLIMQAFKGAGKDLSAIQKKIDESLASQSFEMPAVTVRIATEVTRIKKPIRNVMASISGTDSILQNEWVVVGAHYDHLGLGDRNSLAPSQIGQIHHGADDNASGTSGVLELARLAAENRHSLNRSILFMAFAGEEIGLRGSSYFVNHPNIPLAKVMGMINMDMIGRVNNDRVFVEGVGTARDFKPWLEELNQRVGLKLDYSNSGYGASDHMSFNIKKIPVVFFFSGLHSDYHKPSDTSDKINAAGAVKVLSLAYMMMDRMATTQERLLYTEVREPQQPTGGGGGYGPYFGSIPDFRDDVQGVLFADVQPNSPSAKAGLKAGDLLVQFDGKAIQNLYDFTFALRARKPGDVVSVVVKRGTQEIRTDVTLEARK